MVNKPTLAADYSPDAGRRAKSACLFLATKLGDLLDEIVLVGGLVPSLLIPQSSAVAHIGTTDVDLGLSIGILNQQRYHELCERLRQAGFAPDANPEGRPTNQRWRIEANNQSITVDFLIPPLRETDTGGKLCHFEEGFAAIITPGLDLAFIDRRRITLEGETLHDERAAREIWVCEAGAFVVLKALAFRGRGENKDAYDLVYTLLHYATGIADVVERLRPLLSRPTTQRALDILRDDFSRHDDVGTVRFAQFLGDPRDESLRADAAGAVRALLRRCRETN